MGIEAGVMIVRIDKGDAIVLKDITISGMEIFAENVSNLALCPSERHLDEFRFAALARVLEGINKSLGLPEDDGMVELQPDVEEEIMPQQSYGIGTSLHRLAEEFVARSGETYLGSPEPGIVVFIDPNGKIERDSC